MYLFDSGQIGFEDFLQPEGLPLRQNNRWVRLASAIPWKELELSYAAHFSSRPVGNVAKPFRLALGACVIQRYFRLPDREVPVLIQESPYLQYFCGCSGFQDREPLFSPRSMRRFRARLPGGLVPAVLALFPLSADAPDGAGPPADFSRFCNLR